MTNANTEIPPVTLIKTDSTTGDFPAILKKLLTLKRSICSVVSFQYSCERYIEQIELLKMLYFPRLLNTPPPPPPREVYEVLFLEGCRF